MDIAGKSQSINSIKIGVWSNENINACNFNRVSPGSRKIPKNNHKNPWKYRNISTRYNALNFWVSLNVGNVQHLMRSACCVWRALKVFLLIFAHRYHVRTLLLDLGPHELLCGSPSRCSEQSRERSLIYFRKTKQRSAFSCLEREFKQEVEMDGLFDCLLVCVGGCKWNRERRRTDTQRRRCDKSFGKEEKKRGSEAKDRPSHPRAYFLPWCLVVGLPLNLSRDKAVQGIIHLPVPFSISSTLAGTFCPPLKHKIPSVRNSRTYSPLLSPPPPPLFSGLQMHHKKATWVVL